MRAWFDLKEVDLNTGIDLSDIQRSEKMICDLVAHEAQRGILTHRIILAGFSQGGGLALYTGLRYPKPLGGILALSACLPWIDELVTSTDVANRSIPIMMAHGTLDPLIPLKMAKQTAFRLEEKGYRIKFHTYSMAHGVCEEEINDISKWLQGVFVK